MNGQVRQMLLQTTISLLQNEHISEALTALQALAQECMDGQMSRELDEIQTNYHHMLDFLASGGTDANRALVQKQLACRTLRLAYRMDRHVRLKTATDHYAKAYTALCTKYTDQITDTLMQKWNESVDVEERLDLQDDIFDLLWTDGEWTPRQTALWFEFLGRQDNLVRRHLLGGIILSAWEYPDPEKLTLIRVYAESEEIETATLAAVNIVLLIGLHHRTLLLYPDYAFSLKGKLLKTSLRQTLKEYALILLTLQNQRQEQEELEKTGNASTQDITQALRIHARYAAYRLSHGLDHNMDKVSMLHASPFLKRVSHWWLPYDPTHPQVQRIRVSEDGDELANIAHGLAKLFNCDTDKYALCTILHKTSPKMLRNMDKMSGMLQDAEMQEKMQQSPYKSVLQLLYRIFCHSPLRERLASIFSANENTTQSLDFLFLTRTLNDKDTITVAEQLHQIGKHTDALALLNTISTPTGKDDFRILMLRAKCLMQQGKYQAALDQLSAIELSAQEVNEDILRLKEKCYGELGKVSAQIECLQLLAEINPDDMQVLHSIASLQTKTEQHTAAYQTLCRLQYTIPEDTSVQTELAHCAIRIGRIEVAERYARTLINSEEMPTAAQGHLLCAEISLIKGDWKSATENFRLFCKKVQTAEKTNETSVMKVIEKIQSELIAAGVSAADIGLMMDIIQRAESAPTD